MELFDLEKMEQVIHTIPDTRFDSHRFIKTFVKLYEEEYNTMLKPQKGGHRASGRTWNLQNKHAP